MRPLTLKRADAFPKTLIFSNQLQTNCKPESAAPGATRRRVRLNCNRAAKLTRVTKTQQQGEPTMTEAIGLVPRQNRHTRLKLNYSAIAHNVDEVAELIGIKGNTRQLRARQEIISEGSRFTSPFLLIEGIAIRYRILRDGQRQVLSVILPGDFAGVPSCFFETALYAVRTLTPTTIISIPMSKMVALFDTHPRVVAGWLWTFASETAIYAERLISVSRRPAAERVAHFLLELYTRSRQIGLADESSFYLPLTQAVLSELSWTKYPLC